uniref:Uncharacterized protein n=1 Tax=Oryza glumipatula TaxID=40148 RepID=A0A0D9ZCJ9_9ORYZ
MERTYSNVNGGGGSFFPFRAGGDPERRGQPGVVSPRSGQSEGRRGRRSGGAGGDPERRGWRGGTDCGDHWRRGWRGASATSLPDPRLSVSTPVISTSRSTTSLRLYSGILRVGEVGTKLILRIMHEVLMAINRGDGNGGARAAARPTREVDPSLMTDD